MLVVVKMNDHPEKQCRTIKCNTYLFTTRIKCIAYRVPISCALAYGQCVRHNQITFYNQVLYRSTGTNYSLKGGGN